MLNVIKRWETGVSQQKKTYNCQLRKLLHCILHEDDVNVNIRGTTDAGIEGVNCQFIYSAVSVIICSVVTSYGRDTVLMMTRIIFSS